MYDKAVREVFGALERVEEIVSHQRYLSGSTITEADIRLFTSLIRFDRIYYGLFKVCVCCMTQLIVQCYGGFRSHWKKKKRILAIGREVV